MRYRSLQPMKSAEQRALWSNLDDETINLADAFNRPTDKSRSNTNGELTIAIAI